MPTAAIIGASRGIGLGLVERYASEGWRVHATTRTPERPGALGEVPGDVHVHGLEVTDRDQRRALRKALADEAVDVLIHNAGVYGTGMKTETVNRINSEAPFEVAERLMAAVIRSEQRKIALITSAMGARRGSTRSLGKYGDSKAALNDRFRELAGNWRGRGVLAVVVHPGWVRTDMGGHNAAISVEESACGIYDLMAGLDESGPAISVEESACGIYDLMAGLDESGHGRFWTWEGREHPW